MKKLYWIILSSLFCFSPLLSQDFTRLGPETLDTTVNYGHYFNFVQVRMHRGSNATSSKNETVKDIFAGSGYWGVDVRIGFQTTGQFEWHRVFNNPSYGLGFSSFWFDQDTVSNLIGNPSGVYGFFGWPVYRGKGGKFHLDFDFAAGLTYDLNAYDPITNPYNDAVGSKILWYFDFDFSGNHMISNRLDLSYGLHLVHFSNGRMRTPNLGVNMVGFDLGLRYNFNPMSPYAKYKDPSRQLAVRPELTPKGTFSSYQNYSIWNLWMAMGFNTTSRNAEDIEGNPQDLRGPTYFASTLAVEWQRKLGRAFAGGVGLNYFYDGSLGEEYDDGGSLFQKSTIGIGPSFDLFIHRFSFSGTVGFYVYRAEKVKNVRNPLYLRGAFRYRISEKVFAHAALKTMNGAVADYVEFGIGYSIFNNPNERN